MEINFFDKLFIIVCAYRQFVFLEYIKFKSYYTCYEITMT